MNYIVIVIFFTIFVFIPIIVFRMFQLLNRSKENNIKRRYKKEIFKNEEQVIKGRSFYDWEGFDKNSLREKKGVYQFKDEYNKVFQNYYGFEIIVWFENEQYERIVGFQIDGLGIGIVTYRESIEEGIGFDVSRHDNSVYSAFPEKRQLISVKTVVNKTKILEALSRDTYLETRIKDYIIEKVNTIKN